MEENRIQMIEKDKALDIRAVKNILIIMVIPLIFYLIKLLSNNFEEPADDEHNCCKSH